MNRLTNVIGGFTTHSRKDHFEENQTSKKCSDYQSQALNEDEDSCNLNNRALISFGKERLSSEPIEVLEIDDATNFHQFLLNQIMINKQQNNFMVPQKSSGYEGSGAILGTGGRTDPYE